MKTLVLVDVQNDFMPGGSLAVPDGDKIVPGINEVIQHFDLVVATQDWHPPQHASFASNHEGQKPFESIDLRGVKQTLWPDHCVQGSRGAQFHSELETRPIEAIFRKGIDPAIDSYSGFYDNNHEKSTGLSGYLRDKGAKDLYFCGLAADICVDFTLRDALKEGFSSTLLLDLTRPLNPEAFEAKKKELDDSGALFIKAEDL